MSNELQLIKQNLPVAMPAQPMFVNHGNDVKQIANMPGGVMNFNMSAQPIAMFNASTKINPTYYNLFVVEIGTFVDALAGFSFNMSKFRSLTTAPNVGVDSDISNEFRPLSDKAIVKIKTFPSICASVNTANGKTDDQHLAMLGMVTNVKKAGEMIKIDFYPFTGICQQVLHENAPSLELKSAPALNELDEVHWSIKRVNLVEKLRAANQFIPAPF